MTNPELKTIDVHELKNKMTQSDDLFLIDVREQEEWETIHILNAVHIPKALLNGKISETVTDKNKYIYLHCKGGTRSAFAALALSELGYNNVYSVNGGICEWEKSGYPVVKK